MRVDNFCVTQKSGSEHIIGCYVAPLTGVRHIKKCPTLKEVKSYENKYKNYQCDKKEGVAKVNIDYAYVCEYRENNKVNCSSDRKK